MQLDSGAATPIEPTTASAAGLEPRDHRRHQVSRCDGSLQSVAGPPQAGAAIASPRPACHSTGTPHQSDVVNVALRSGSARECGASPGTRGTRTSARLRRRTVLDDGRPSRCHAHIRKNLMAITSGEWRGATLAPYRHRRPSADRCRRSRPRADGALLYLATASTARIAVSFAHATESRQRTCKRTTRTISMIMYRYSNVSPTNGSRRRLFSGHA